MLLKEDTLANNLFNSTTLTPSAHYNLVNFYFILKNCQEMFSLPVVLIFVSLFKKYYYSFPHEALMDVLFLYIFILLYLKRLWFNYFQKVMCFYC